MRYQPVHRSVILASDYFKPILDDLVDIFEHSTEYISFSLNITPTTLRRLTALLRDITVVDYTVGDGTGTIMTPESFSRDSVHLRFLPNYFRASWYLQLHCVTNFLVSCLNRLCQYHDPRLEKLGGKINPYWLEDLSKVNVAAKDWLGIHGKLWLGIL
jgi:hypothetical protein